MHWPPGPPGAKSWCAAGAADHGVADLVYHDLLMALSQELPDCDLEVRTDTSCTSPEEVLQSGVDALIQILLEPVSDATDCLPLFDTKCHLLASPGSPLSACGT